MNETVLTTKLGDIAEKLARIEERMVASDRRENAMIERVVTLEHRLADIEKARWWLAGAAAILASVAGWFARSFTPSNHGGPQ